MAWKDVALLVLLCTAVNGMPGQEFPVRPYVDPTQLDVPWPKHSHLKVPWRGYLETRSGYEFLKGIGVNYNVPDRHDLAIRLLAEAGFKTFRIEIGWGSVNWDETHINGEGRWRTVLQLCKRYGIRPTLLLNAHHGVPCPLRFFERHLTADAPNGSRTIKLDDVTDIVPRYSGLCNLTHYCACEVFITEVNPQTGECQLSKPLPKDLKAGQRVTLATLKYLPAYPVGTPEFEATAKGWLRYVQLVVDLLKSVGVDAFDLEVWNELSFGSNFMNGWGINNYYDPPIVQFKADFLHPGGHAWEIARRTVDLVKSQCPQARCIWGFSNTTFFHTLIEKLPPLTDGQSYHPYGTGTRKLPEHEQARDEPWRCLEGDIPKTELRMPEGWAHTFVQTESLMRLLNPEGRLKRKPQGIERFFHYMTEHGVAPPECGVTDERGAWLLKAKTVLRAFCFWLNKGIDVMHYFCAYGERPTDMGVLPTNLETLPDDAPFEQVATLPMKALRNLTRTFADSRPLKQGRRLSVDVVALGEQTPIYTVAGKTLWHRDVFAFLPFQCHDRKFVIAVYTMTYDVTRPIAPERYRLTISGFGGTPERVHLYDPLTDKTVPITVLRRGKDNLAVEMAVVDYPRLLVVDL
ncbi:hypothetical protein HRbin17_01565 [bacterium HR17]|uniref:Glycoside hydrolase family 5 domain-containing protein n=1 Tax=Candidatus Fervidibacter japonicus TaxID=2035412 RepID=A0A2H5XCZ7_9BACT|nr:hypothetical protein HRbin17_01565 [bacterium HR17]